MSWKEGASSRRRIVSKVARLSGLTNQQASDCLDALISVMQESLYSIGQISIRGLGIFQLMDRKLRNGYNMQTKNTEIFLQKKVIKFKASSLFEKQCFKEKETQLLIPISTSMEVIERIKLEQSNQGLIYFYANSADKFVAYELSAYILSKAYNSSIALDLKDFGEYAKDILVATIPPNLVLAYLSGENTLVNNDYIQVDLGASLGSKILLWKNEFEARFF